LRPIPFVRRVMHAPAQCSRRARARARSAARAVLRAAPRSYEEPEMAAPDRRCCAARYTWRAARHRPERRAHSSAARSVHAAPHVDGPSAHQLACEMFPLCW
jgi:hypothetical protein